MMLLSPYLLDNTALDLFVLDFFLNNFPIAFGVFVDNWGLVTVFGQHSVAEFKSPKNFFAFFNFILFRMEKVWKKFYFRVSEVTLKSS